MSGIDDACRRCLAENATHAGQVFVGFSGGMDSSVLLHAIKSIAPRRVVALHVNHGIQDESDVWEAHCRDVCDAWSIPLKTTRANLTVSSNIESIARQRRYEFFAQELRPSDLLLLAHHADDQQETQLLHLLQGRGLYGMPGMRPLAEGVLLRPLLELAKKTLYDYAVAQDLTWCEDASNLDLRLDRNYLRHRLLPQLKDRFPGFPHRLANFSARIDVQQQMLSALLPLRGDRLPLSELLSRSIVERVEILRLWLLSRTLNTGVSEVSLRAFARQLDVPAQRQPVLQLAAGTIRRYGDALHYVARLDVPLVSQPLAVPGELALAHGVLVIESVTLAQAADPAVFAVNGKVTLRFRQGGETLLRGGHQRTLKQIFQEARVPPWQRACYPLLFDERGLLAIPNITSRNDIHHGETGGWRALWRWREQRD